MVSLDFRMKRSHGARVQPCVKVGMQSFLKSEGYDQIPQLSVGNHKFNLKKNFTVLNPNRRKGKGGRTREGRGEMAMTKRCATIGSLPRLLSLSHLD